MEWQTEKGGERYSVRSTTDLVLGIGVDTTSDHIVLAVDLEPALLKQRFFNGDASGFIERLRKQVNSFLSLQSLCRRRGIRSYLVHPNGARACVCVCVCVLITATACTQLGAICMYRR